MIFIILVENELRQPNSNHIHIKKTWKEKKLRWIFLSLLLVLKKGGCLTKYLLVGCWLFDCCSNDIVLDCCCSSTLRATQHQRGTAQIAYTYYYFTFHPRQILYNLVGFFLLVSKFFESTVLIIIVLLYFHADYFGQTGRSFLLLSLPVFGFCTLVNRFWLDKKIITTIKQQGHSIFNNREEWTKKINTITKAKDEEAAAAAAEPFLSRCQMNWCVLNNELNILLLLFFHSIAHMLFYSFKFFFFHIPSFHFYSRLIDCHRDHVSNNH